MADLKHEPVSVTQDAPASVEGMVESLEQAIFDFAFALGRGPKRGEIVELDQRFTEARTALLSVLTPSGGGIEQGATPSPEAPQTGIQVPDGWVLVPREPTLAMQNAGWREIGDQDLEPEDVEIAPIYRAMISRAPAPSRQEGGGRSEGNDANGGGEAPAGLPAMALPDGWEFGADCASHGYWSVTLVRLGDGRQVKGTSTNSMPDAQRKAQDLARRAPALTLAEGCCSAVSPCSHQCRSPYTICDICQKAAGLSASPPPSQEKNEGQTQGGSDV